MTSTQTHSISPRIFFDRHRPSIERCTILLIALSVRIACGYIFFGSTDLITTIENSQLLIDGTWITLPYFPAVNALIWFGGVLNAYAPLPLAFCYKLTPILFDSLLAVLIYDIVLRRDEGCALPAGLLYALCPVPIIINCLHMQWDSIALFLLLLGFHIREDCRDSQRQSFLFGCLFGLSVLVKPIGLIFLLVFFKGYPKRSLAFHRRQYIGSLTGLALVVLVGLLVLRLYGYPIWDPFERVANYATRGSEFFGLPFGYPVLRHYFDSNFLLIPVIAAFALLHYAKVISVFSMMLLSYAFIYAVAGLAPQYLIWIVPFLLVTRHFRAGAIYTLLATAFLLLYYVNEFDPKNMNTYVTLKGFEWLMPSLRFAGGTWKRISRFLGNYLLPFFAAGLIIDIIVTRLISMRKRISGDAATDRVSTIPLKPLSDGYLWAVILTPLALLAASLLENRRGLIHLLNGRIGEKISLYAMPSANIYPSFGIGAVGYYPRTSTVDIMTILLGIAIVWGVYAALVPTNRMTLDIK